MSVTVGGDVVPPSIASTSACVMKLHAERFSLALAHDAAAKLKYSTAGQTWLRKQRLPLHIAIVLTCP
jgi:hypothetical protein